jgi:hypothetical protein
MQMGVECMIVDHPAFELCFVLWEASSTYASPYTKSVEILFSSAKQGAVKAAVFMTGMHSAQVNSVMNLGLAGLTVLADRVRFQIVSGPSQQLNKFQVSYLFVDLGLIISPGEIVFAEYYR